MLVAMEKKGLFLFETVKKKKGGARPYQNEAGSSVEICLCRRAKQKKKGRGTRTVLFGGICTKSLSRALGLKKRQKMQNALP